MNENSNNAGASLLTPYKKGLILKNIQKFGSYLTGNTLHLRYKGQQVYCENLTQHTTTFCEQNAEF
jgi:hypothetical protein